MFVIINRASGQGRPAALSHQFAGNVDMFRIRPCSHAEYAGRQAKTAKALGLTVPLSLQVAVDEVID